MDFHFFFLHFLKVRYLNLPRILDKCTSGNPASVLQRKFNKVDKFSRFGSIQ